MGKPATRVLWDATEWGHRILALADEEILASIDVRMPEGWQSLESHSQQGWYASMNIASLAGLSPFSVARDASVWQRR